MAQLPPGRRTTWRKLKPNDNDKQQKRKVMEVLPLKSEPTAGKRAGPPRAQKSEPTAGSTGPSTTSSGIGSGRTNGTGHKGVATLLFYMLLLTNNMVSAKQLVTNHTIVVGKQAGLGETRPMQGEDGWYEQAAGQAMAKSLLGDHYINAKQEGLQYIDICDQQGRRRQADDDNTRMGGRVGALHGCRPRPHHTYGAGKMLL